MNRDCRGITVKLVKIFMLTGLALAALSASAQELNYVNDILVITLRSGPGNQYQIIKTIPSGTEMAVLERPNQEYAKVRLTKDGTEGWVLTQYLTSKPVARQRLAAAEARLAKVEEQNQKLNEELAALRQSHGSLEKDAAALRDQYDSEQKRLARLQEVSARPLQLEAENKELKQQNITLSKNLDILTQENNALQDRSERDWFVAGAGVLLVGMIVGLIVPKLRLRKKNSWEL